MVCIVMWSSLVGLLCYLGTLCGCGGFGDCNTCTVVCVACEDGESLRVRG